MNSPCRPSSFSTLVPHTTTSICATRKLTFLGGISVSCDYLRTQPQLPSPSTPEFLVFSNELSWKCSARKHALSKTTTTPRQSVMAMLGHSSPTPGTKSRHRRSAIASLTYQSFRSGCERTCEDDDPIRKNSLS